MKMLRYEIIDNNHDDWVVFIHGIGGSTNTWKKQIDNFSKQYNLLLLDLPGHGKNADNIIHKVEPKRLNNGIIETLDYLKIKEAHFVGLSLGTIVIANFAVNYPTRVTSIILGGSVLDICGIYRTCVSFVNGIKRIVPYKFLYKFFAWFMLPKKNHEKSRQIFLREVVKLNKETMFAWIGYLADSLHPGNLFNKLDTLGKKILFISGDEDHCFLKGSKILAQRLKMAEIKIIEHCGHVCSIEKYDIFNNFALSYLVAI
jgi:pimeloyl-ACP methyl ester carboxylesterase